MWVLFLVKKKVPLQFPWSATFTTSILYLKIRLHVKKKQLKIATSEVFPTKMKSVSNANLAIQLMLRPKNVSKFLWTVKLKIVKPTPMHLKPAPNVSMTFTWMPVPASQWEKPRSWIAQFTNPQLNAKFVLMGPFPVEMNALYSQTLRTVICLEIWNVISVMISIFWMGQMETLLITMSWAVIPLTSLNSFTKTCT